VKKKEQPGQLFIIFKPHFKESCPMRKITALILFCISTASYGQSNIAIIPEPVSIKTGVGNFALPQNITIEAPSQPEMKQVIAVLKDRLSVPTGCTVSVSNSSPNATIRLVLNKTADPKMGKEGYGLSVTAKNILIKANEPAGLFYGVQTLLQLLPKEIESATRVANMAWIVPVTEINDVPRFGWRGLMFDVTGISSPKQK
jgi:hexosaminidase